MKYQIRIYILLAFLALSINATAQPPAFLDHLRIGFGAGVNAAHIIDLSPYNIFEDLTGVEYENSYTGIVRNISNQYFVQAEWYNKYMAIVLKPGTYSYQFSKQNEVIFNSGTTALETPYLLRYISIPLELRYNVDIQRFRPYGGVTATYSHLLGSNDASNLTFIRPRFSAGMVLGSYIDLRYIILDINLGYSSGLHNIASKVNRFGTGGGQSFAQDDLLLNDLRISFSILFSLQKQRRFSNIECYY